MTLEILSSLLEWPLKTLHLTFISCECLVCRSKTISSVFLMNLLLLGVSIGPQEGGGRRRQSLCWHGHWFESQRNNCPTQLKLPKRMLTVSNAYKCIVQGGWRDEKLQRERTRIISPSSGAIEMQHFPPCCLIITTNDHNRGLVCNSLKVLQRGGRICQVICFRKF